MDAAVLALALYRYPQCARRWGYRVCHVWDWGFASAAWLDEVLKEVTERHLRFVLR